MLALEALINATPVFWLAALTATLLVAVSKSGLGGGMGALAAPLLLLAIPAKTTLAVLLPVFIATDLYVAWRYRKHSVRRLVVLMFAAACIGQLLGWLLFKYIDDHTLKILIGGLAFFMGAHYFWRVFTPLQTDPRIARLRLRKTRQQRGPRAAVWCTLSGLSSFVSLTGGIPAQIYLLPFRLPRAFYVGTMGWFFLLINLAKLPFFIELGLFSAESLTLSAALLPVLPLGIALGLWLHKKMSDTVFYHVSHGFLLILGARLIWTGFA